MTEADVPLPIAHCLHLPFHNRDRELALERAVGIAADDGGGAGIVFDAGFDGVLAGRERLRQGQVPVCDHAGRHAAGVGCGDASPAAVADDLAIDEKRDIDARHAAGVAVDGGLHAAIGSDFDIAVVRHIDGLRQSGNQREVDG